MPFCVKCGYKVPDDITIKFCPSCGTNVVHSAAPADEQAPVADATSAAAPTSATEPQHTAPPEYEEEEEDPFQETSNPFDAVKTPPAVPNRPLHHADHKASPPLPSRPPRPAPAAASASASSTASAPTDQESPARSSARQRLVIFYSEHNPEKLKDLQALEKTLDYYAGREEQLFIDLEAKYLQSLKGSGPTRKAGFNKNFTLEEHKVVPNIVDGLKRLYRQKVLPVEKAFKFGQFHSPSLTNTDFDAAPIVLLLGQYSTGKTTFIKYLVEREFPGQRIGPEPTTDRFVAVMHGPDERVTPGNAAAVDAKKPFRALQKFGMTFLNKFEVSQCPAPILEKISFVDTPGVLSGEKQRIARGYDFPRIVEWFAERADRILLLFDAHKLDISDEFKSVIEATRGHEDKIRVVLNKADMVSSQQLMRVYGALMWSLGKVLGTPEVLRVYIGSFWDKPLQNKENEELFTAESNDLLADLRSLPRYSAVRKVNEFVKRARMAKVHAYIINHLKSKFGWFGKEKTQKKLIANLAPEFRAVQAQYNLPKGDFPNIKRFKDTLQRFKIHEFPKLDEASIQAMDAVLARDIPRLMELLPGYNEAADDFVHGANINPFDDANQAIRAPAQVGWSIDSATKNRFDNIFGQLPKTSSGKVTGKNAAAQLASSGLGKNALKAIWALADMDKDGMMDSAEFAVAMFLVERCLDHAPLPQRLPAALVPPNKRHLIGY